MAQKLIFIIEQMVAGRVPLDMSHKGVSAPLAQIRILKIIENMMLATASLSALKSPIQEVLVKILQRCSVSFQYFF